MCEIQENYSLSQRRSLFIARQETNLCLANYQKERYLNLGINEYKWKTADDEKVRNYPKNNKSGGNHKRLNNLIFSFDNPPITNELTGERHNPSEEYGCRCVAQPIIR